MSQSEVERFARDVKTDAALQAEVGKADRLETTISVAVRRGYAFTAEELMVFVQARATAAGTELSTADLDAVAGGARLVEHLSPFITY